MIWFFFVVSSLFFHSFCSYLGQVEGAFAQWMQSSSSTTSPNLDILPDAEGEGRCVVCTNDLEKGALICNESLGGSKTHPQKQQPAVAAVGGNSDSSRCSMVFLGCFVGFVRGFLRISRWKAAFSFESDYHLGSCQGEVLVRLPAAAAVSVSMDASAPAEPSLATLEGWWMRHPRSSIRLAAKLVFQRETFAPYIEMLYPLEQKSMPLGFGRRKTWDFYHHECEKCFGSKGGFGNGILKTWKVKACQTGFHGICSSEPTMRLPHVRLLVRPGYSGLCRILNPKKAPCLDQEQRLPPKDNQIWCFARAKSRPVALQLWRWVAYLFWFPPQWGWKPDPKHRGKWCTKMVHLGPTLAGSWFRCCSWSCKLLPACFDEKSSSKGIRVHCKWSW